MSYVKRYNEDIDLEEFRKQIIDWYKVSNYPQVLIDDIMKDYPASSLGPMSQGTPQTVARLLVKEYAISNKLIYDVSPLELQRHLEERFNASYRY